MIGNASEESNKYEEQIPEPQTYEIVNTGRVSTSRSLEDSYSVNNHWESAIFAKYHPLVCKPGTYNTTV